MMVCFIEAGIGVAVALRAVFSGRSQTDFDA
jgi:hypothetical protein